MDQNQTPSTTIDQNQTLSTTTIEQNQSTTTTMNQNHTSSTSTNNTFSSLMIGFKPLVGSLVMRLITFSFLLVSLIVMATNSFDTFDIYGFPVKVDSTDIHVYR